MGGRAVGLDCGGRLWVAHFDEGCADGKRMLAVEEDCSSFGLGGGRHDGADGLKFGEYWSVCSEIRPYVGRWRIVAQVVVACSTNAHFGMNKIRCVTIDV